MFASYVESPTNCRFQGQDPDEKILLLLRAHPITNFSWIIPAILLFSLPFLVPLVVNATGLNFSFIPDSYQIVFLIINYLIVLVYLL